MTFCVPDCLPPPQADPARTPLQIGPDCHNDEWGAPAGGEALFAPSGGQQLFEDGTSVELLHNGTLTYSLAHFRHGSVNPEHTPSNLNPKP